jgi:hypothetical protein
MPTMTRLPGRATKTFGFTTLRYQLWLTPEYLMFREIAGYRETVKRYYYTDIQAIVTTPTRAGRICTLVTSILVLAAIALTVAVTRTAVPDAIAVIPLFLGFIALLVLVGNLFFGPTCSTTLYTATSEARLFSLGRQWATRRALERILPFIEAAQRTEPPSADGTAEPGLAAEASFDASGGFGSP